MKQRTDYINPVGEPYWGTASLEEQIATCVRIIEHHQAIVEQWRRHLRALQYKRWSD